MSAAQDQSQSFQWLSRLDRVSRNCILLHGAEPLLLEESRDAVRQHFAAQGYTDVKRLTAESGFDWSTFGESSRSLSLFAEKQYTELRLPTGKPGDKGAAAIESFVNGLEPDNVLVVVCGKLDKKLLAAKWIKAIQQEGLVVDAGSIAANQLPRWIMQRFARQGVSCDTDVAAQLAWFVEGNLLAADQEIQKLSLVVGPQGVLDTALLESVMADQARFNVFSFADSCLAGKSGRSLRILSSLRREGTDPILLAWALTREVRTLARIKSDIERGESPSSVFSKHRVWSSRGNLVGAAMKRLSGESLKLILRRLALADRVIKGQDRIEDGPSDIWIELERIALAICGINLSLSANAV